MPVVLVHQGAGLTRESYEETVRKLTDGNGVHSPADWPVEGLLIHIAGEAEGGFRVGAALEQFEGDLALKQHIEGAINGAHPPRSNDLAQFKLPQAPGKHDRMAALVAGNGLQRGQITWDPVAGLAGAANGPAHHWAALLGGRV